MPTNTDTHFPNGLPRIAKVGDVFTHDRRCKLVVDEIRDGAPFVLVYLRVKGGWSCRGFLPMEGVRAANWVMAP